MKVSGLVLLATVLAACGDGNTVPSAQTAPAMAVTAVIARETRLSGPIMATGDVRPDKLTEVKPRVDGVIEAILVDVGDKVAAGQPLFRTRPADYHHAFNERQQALAVAQAEQRQAEGELNRARALLAKGVISQGRMDEVQARFDTARARTGMADAALARARQDLADATVPAPYDGIVTARFLDEGTMVRVATANTPVVEVAKLDTVEIVAQVPAAHLSRIRVGMPVTVRVEGLAEPVEGAIGVINDKVDARTRNVEIRLHLPNPDLSIKPGLFARLALQPDGRDAIVLDRRAVLGAEEARFVFVPDGAVARRRDIRVRDVGAEEVEILDGLAPGERVLASPVLADLRDGAPILLGSEHGAR